MRVGEDVERVRPMVTRGLEELWVGHFLSGLAQIQEIRIVGDDGLRAEQTAITSSCHV